MKTKEAIYEDIFGGLDIAPEIRQLILIAMDQYESQDKFIDVEDENPKETGHYLVYYANQYDNGLKIEFFRKDDKNIHQGWQYSDVIAFQPLPELPERHL